MPRRNKTIVDVASLARNHTELALNTLSGLARSPKCPPAARVAAAVALLDRAWGRPYQAHTGADGGDIKVTIRQIIETVGQNGREPQVIEGECHQVAVGDSITNRMVDDENTQQDQ